MNASSRTLQILGHLRSSVWGFAFEVFYKKYGAINQEGNVCPASISDRALFRINRCLYSSSSCPDNCPSM